MNRQDLNLPYENVPLSNTGAARSEAIRQSMLASARTHRRRRALLRAATAVTAIALVASAAYIALQIPGPSAPKLDHTIVKFEAPSTHIATPTPTPEPVHAAQMVVVVANSAATFDQWDVRGPVTMIREIDDAELIALAEETGNRYGLMRMGDLVRMVCLDCPSGSGGLH